MVVKSKEILLYPKNGCQTIQVKDFIFFCKKLPKDEVGETKNQLPIGDFKKPWPLFKPRPIFWRSPFQPWVLGVTCIFSVNNCSWDLNGPRTSKLRSSFLRYSGCQELDVFLGNKEKHMNSLNIFSSVFALKLTSTINFYSGLLRVMKCDHKIGKIKRRQLLPAIFSDLPFIVHCLGL